MATYSTAVSDEGKSKYLPLKNAIAEYGENSGKLLELLATVHKAAGQSNGSGSGRGMLIQAYPKYVNDDVFGTCFFKAAEHLNYFNEVGIYANLLK